MATQQVAWTVDNLNNLAVLYSDYQTPPYTADWDIIDLTISSSGTVMVLARDGEQTIVHHAADTFPLEWSSTTLKLDKAASTPSEPGEEVTQAVHIDASPDDTLYIVLNSGLLASVKLPTGKDTEVSPTLVKGVDHVSQVSAAPDGLVWVVCSDPAVGSVVKWMDAKGKWSQVPDLNNARQVTGGPKGKAFIINSADELANYTKKGVKTEIPCDFGPKALSIGPDGRLWVIATHTAENLCDGSVAYWTDDDGKNWTEIPGSNVNNLDAGIINSEFN